MIGRLLGHFTGVLGWNRPEKPLVLLRYPRVETGIESLATS